MNNNSYSIWNKFWRIVQSWFLRFFMNIFFDSAILAFILFPSITDYSLGYALWKESATYFTFLWLFNIDVSLNFRFFFCKEIPACISYICRVSPQYIFFFQETNLSIIQCCLGIRIVIISCIYMVSFSFFILQQQILYFLLLRENSCPHFLHLYGFSSVWILLAENKFEYPLGTAQSLHLYGFSLVWISSIFFIILKILLINFIFKKIWSFSKLIHLCCPKQPQDPPHFLHSYGLSPLMILWNLFKISSKNVWNQLQFLKILLCWLN